MFLGWFFGQGLLDRLLLMVVLVVACLVLVSGQPLPGFLPKGPFRQEHLGPLLGQLPPLLCPILVSPASLLDGLGFNSAKKIYK